MCFLLSKLFFSENAPRKRRKKTDDIMTLGDFMTTKKTRSAIPSNLAVVARRDLCSEAQS